MTAGHKPPSRRTAELRRRQPLPPLPQRHRLPLDLAHRRRPLWVFGYGSLMWRPGFPVEAVLRARLSGWQRALCVWSVHHRGRPGAEGLVLGLRPGGQCWGLAYKVPTEARAAALAYLARRELVTAVYLPRLVTVHTARGRVPALTFVADTAHLQFARHLGEEEAARVVARASGLSGHNRDYLETTVQRIAGLGFRDPALERLMRRVAALDV
ncbi:gamma-glutamylcyclotransferase [Marinibaculum pumilum]|uniref:glutathione-specific gamma-glutamylcyclotransferase n=1 Tax=Marinibaculum pumilum TaxID=1766165 RepID=A0ABV7L5Y1_9PROT